MTTPSTDEAGRARRQGLLHLGADGGTVAASVPKIATGIPGFDEVAMGVEEPAGDLTDDPGGPRLFTVVGGGGVVDRRQPGRPRPDPHHRCRDP